MLKRSASLLLVLLIPLLGFVGCGTPSPSDVGNRVEMTQLDFAPHTVSITAGSSVRFDNPASGITHVLCIGQDGSCNANALGPVELTASGGMAIDAGQVEEITFELPGTYKIACLLHPSMNLTVTAQ